MDNSWMTQHMHAVLLVIEVFWVAGVLAIFVFYFMVKRRVLAKKRKQAAEASRADPGPPGADRPSGPDHTSG